MIFCTPKLAHELHCEGEYRDDWCPVCNPEREPEIIEFDGWLHQRIGLNVYTPVMELDE